MDSIQSRRARPDARVPPRDPGTAEVDRALGLLADFRRRILPVFLRRYASWRGFCAQTRADLLEELGQELALDCIEHPRAVIAHDTAARHARWFRIVQNHHYRIAARSTRRRARGEELDALPAAAPYHEVALDADDASALELIEAHACRLRNGRINLCATARQLGVPTAALRRAWWTLADRLGLGIAHSTFWQQRLVEALVACASAALLHAGVLRTFTPVDPNVTTTVRLCRIRRALAACPQPREVRSALARFAGGRQHHRAACRDARALLDAALRIRPGDVCALLWRFEAAIAADESDVALRCLRRARTCGAPTVPVTLARARLCEARARLDRARAVLARALARAHDTRLERCLLALDHAAPVAPTRVRIAGAGYDGRADDSLATGAHGAHAIRAPSVRSLAGHVTPRALARWP